MRIDRWFGPTTYERGSARPSVFRTVSCCLSREAPISVRFILLSGEDMPGARAARRRAREVTPRRRHRAQRKPGRQIPAKRLGRIEKLQAPKMFDPAALYTYSAYPPQIMWGIATLGIIGLNNARFLTNSQLILRITVESARQ